MDQDHYTLTPEDKRLIAENTHSFIGERLRPWIPLFFLVLAEFLFAIQSVCVRLLEVVSISSFEVLQFRGLSQVPCCILWFIVTKESRLTWFGESCNASKLALLQSGIAFGTLVFSFASLRFLPISDWAVIQETITIWSAFFALTCIGEAWHLAEFCASCFCLVGVIFTARPVFIFGQEEHAATNIVPEDHFLGVMFACLSALLGGGQAVVMRASSTHVKVSWVTIMLYQGIVQMCISWPCSFMANENFRILDTRESLLMLIICALGFVGYTLLTIGQQREKSARGSLVRKGVSPLFAIIMQSTLMPSDPLPWTTYVGFIIIFCGLSIVVADKAKRDANDSDSGDDSSDSCPFTPMSR